MSNIVIVGADQGIGYHLAQSLLEAGNNVAVMDIQTEHIQQLKAKYTDTLMVIKADATDEESIIAGVQSSHASFGSIDIAIHNACLCTFESEANSEIEIYQNVMDVNYYGALRLAKAVLPFMRESQSGRVIFTCSGVGVTGFENISPYASSKGAIEALAKCLEIENCKYGISFHVFHPPLTNTESASGLPIPKEFKADPQKVGKGLAKHIYTKKFVICPNASQALSMFLCYRYPLTFGKMLTKAAQRAKAALSQQA